MLSIFYARRDETRFFAPDFQAQLIEDEIGPDYFRVWQSIETDISGPVHIGIAELASKGRLAAIITTNFDRLLEIALQDRGVAYRVFHKRKVGRPASLMQAINLLLRRFFGFTLGFQVQISAMTRAILENFLLPDPFYRVP